MNKIFHILMYNAFTNQYTSYKHIKYPEHSPMNLFDSLQKFAKLPKHLEKPLIRLIFGSLSNHAGNVNRKSVVCHFCLTEKEKHKNILFFKIKFKYFIRHCVQKASLTLKHSWTFCLKKITFICTFCGKLY